MIIAFSSVKGGVGKTSSCCNLAYFFANKGKRVLVVDFDCQGGATHHLSAKFEKKFKASLGDILKGKFKPEYGIHEYGKNLDLIPISFNFYEIASTNFEDKLKEIVVDFDKKYDFIFFDLAPSVYPGTIIPLALSNYAIVPVDCPGGLSLLGLQSEEEIIAQLRKNKKSSVELLGVLPCFFDRTKMSQDVMAFLERNYKKYLLPSVRRNTHISQASSIGKTIFEYKPSSNGAKDYAKVGSEIIKRLNF